MPTPPITVGAENIICIGWGKQGAWGTPTVPSGQNWWRWLDGTEANPETGFTMEREGDTSRYKSYVQKTSEYGKVVIVERARPNTVGCAIQAVMGTSSDVLTAPTFNTTLGASVSAGATTIKTVADLGNVGTLDVAIGPLTATYEVVKLDLTTRTTPNFTYTLAASGACKNAHSNADPVQTKAQHVMTPAATTYDPYCLEVQYGVSGTAPFGVEQYLDAVCTEVRLTAEKGKALMLQHTWYSRLIQRKAAFTSPVSYEGNGVVGTPGAPYVWNQAQNNWLLDGGAINGRLERLELTIKNTTDPLNLLTDGLNPGYFTLDLIDIDGSAQYLFSDFNQYFKTYYGNTTTPTSTATDDYHIGTGSISTTWTADAINSMALNLSSMAYMAAKKAPPKLTGQALRQAVSFSALRTPAVGTPLMITLTNTANTAY
jgi:hypothetical protein